MVLLIEIILNHRISWWTYSIRYFGIMVYQRYIYFHRLVCLFVIFNSLVGSRFYYLFSIITFDFFLKGINIHHFSMFILGSHKMSLFLLFFYPESFFNGNDLTLCFNHRRINVFLSLDINQLVVRHSYFLNFVFWWVLWWREDEILMLWH